MVDNINIERFYESDDEPNLTVVKQHYVTETYPIHTHNFDEFFLVTKGRARHNVNAAGTDEEAANAIIVHQIIKKQPVPPLPYLFLL